MHAVSENMQQGKETWGSRWKPKKKREKYWEVPKDKKQQRTDLEGYMRFMEYIADNHVGLQECGYEK